jgi:DNA-binding response OmpR family regulator
MNVAGTWPVCGSLTPTYRPFLQPSKMPRLLYVDQSAETLIGFTALLAMSGYLPLAMQDPRVALDVARSTSLNLAVLNYDLPVMNGLELARQIRQVKPALPIVLLLDRCPVAENIPVVVNYCLPKDADLSRLLRRINLYLSNDLAA